MPDERADSIGYPPRGTFDETMMEISGFGGGYEDACQRMLRAGLEWLDAHPDAALEFQQLEGVVGLIQEKSPDAKVLSEAILAAEPECSSAMHHVVIRACIYIRGNGWEKYVDAKRAQLRREQN